MLSFISKNLALWKKSALIFAAISVGATLVFGPILVVNKSDAVSILLLMQTMLLVAFPIIFLRVPLLVRMTF